MTEPRFSLSELAANGFPVSTLTPEQQEVLRNLTEEEFAILVDVRARLDEAGPDVQAHSEIAGAALF